MHHAFSLAVVGVLAYIAAELHRLEKQIEWFKEYAERFHDNTVDWPIHVKVSHN